MQVHDHDTDGQSLQACKQQMEIEIFHAPEQTQEDTELHIRIREVVFTRFMVKLFYGHLRSEGDPTSLVVTCHALQ